MRHLRFFLDANVLVDAQGRDLILRVAEAGYIEVFWSDRVLEETARALRKMLPTAAGAERLVDALKRAFPWASVAGYETIEAAIILPDEDDRHVLAAAAAGECDVLVTSNLKDFPDVVCDAHDVLAASVDDALVLVAGQVGPQIAELVRSQIAAMRRPSTTEEAFVERLSERAPQAAMMIGALLGLPELQRMHAEALRANSAESPQETVRLLIDALNEGDSKSVAALVDPSLRRRLAPPDGRAPRLTDVLRAQLDDVLTGSPWGFATGWRPQAPDVELVKLVQAGEGVRIARRPQVHSGHLFLLRKNEDRWHLIDLDGPDPGMTEVTELGHATHD